MSVEYSGERFIPEECQGEMAVEHYQRYQFAAQMVKNKVVLDAACGEGYGSSLLAQEAASVIGLDLDEETLERARGKYWSSKLSFLSGSVEKLPFEDKFFDVVVSYETIEHIDEEMQKKFLTEIDRVLKPDGILIISTPNKTVYTDLVKGQNPFHKKEFYPSEFQQFLDQYFKETNMFCQYPDLGYFISHENENFTIYNKKGKKREHSRYMIAVCSNADQSADLRPYELAVFDDSMYYQLNRYGHEKEEEILKLREEAENFEKQLEESICEQKEYIAKLEKDIQDMLEAKKHPIRYFIKKLRRK